MRIPNNHSRGSVGFNMTPMIDIVFLLIIFFLVSSHLARQETQLELDLPAAASGHRAEDDDRARRVIVNVLANPRTANGQDDEGQIMIGGKVLILMADLTRMSTLYKLPYYIRLAKEMMDELLIPPIVILR